MIECVIDTHVLADLLTQYSSRNRTKLLNESSFLTKNILKKINDCIVSDGFTGTISASSFAFIEIINQFETVSKNQFKLSKVIGILTQPPDWFITEPFTIETITFLTKIPKYNLKGNAIELADAIHVATAMQRGPNTYLATHDGILKDINYKNLGIFHLL